MNQLWGALPLAVPVTGACATLMAGSWPAIRRIAWATCASLWLLGVLAVMLPLPWDPLARWYNLLVLALGGLSLAVSIAYVGSEHAHGEVGVPAARGYFALFAAFVAALLAIGCMRNYLGIWAAVEGTTLTSIFLVAFHRAPGPVEAAWKYLVVTGIGGLCALAGTVLVLHGSGLALAAWRLGPPGPLAAGGRTAIEAGLILAVAGYGSKAGLVPFHTWLPDAHSEAPAPVSAALSSVKLVGGLYALLRLDALATAAIGPGWPRALLLVAGLLSLAIAAAAVPGQRDLKRLFAYSSIEHMGVIALGVAFGGVGVLGALLHMWTHGFSKSALFYGAGNVRLRYGSTGAPGVRGVLAAMPFSGSGLVLGAVAIVGLPPFGLFWSEWLVLLGGVRAGQLIWVGVALAFLVINFLGFGLRLPDLLLGAAPAPQGRRETAASIWPLGVAVAGALVVGLAIPAAFHGTWMAAAQLLGGGGLK